MDRLEQLRQVVDQIVRNNPDPEEARCGFVHLYGVSVICTLLALKRGLDPELCAAAGMLHDVAYYATGEDQDHAARSAVEAARLLSALGSFSADEISAMCAAIAGHSDKAATGDGIAEVLTDADILQHYLYNTSLYAANNPELVSTAKPVKPGPTQRLKKVIDELGLATE